MACSTPGPTIILCPLRGNIVPKHNTLVLSKRLVTQRNCNPSIPSDLLIGLRPSIGTEALDERGTRQIIGIPLRSCRNLDGLTHAAVRHLGAIAGAGYNTVLDNGPFRHSRHGPFGLVVHHAVSLGEDSAAVGPIDAKLRAIESVGSNRAEE